MLKKQKFYIFFRKLFLEKSVLIDARKNRRKLQGENLLYISQQTDLSPLDPILGGNFIGNNRKARYKIMENSFFEINIKKSLKSL